MIFGGGDQKVPAAGGLFERTEGKTHNGDGPSSMALPAAGYAGAIHELGHALGFGHTAQRAEMLTPTPAPGPSPAPAAASTHAYDSVMAYSSSPFAGMY